MRISGWKGYDDRNGKLQASHPTYPWLLFGCISLYEPDHRLLFTGDTVFAGGVLSASLPWVYQRLREFSSRLSGLRVDEIYPGHGKISNMPQEDLQRAVDESRAILEDSKIIFETLDTKASFARLSLATRKVSKSK